MPGETVVRHNVTIVAPLHLSSELAHDASQMYARNITALLKHLAAKGQVELDLSDEITNAVIVTARGEVRLAAASSPPAPAASKTARTQEAKV